MATEIRKQSRYLSVRNEGQEIYVEDISQKGSIQGQLKYARKRLSLIRQALPAGDWTMTVEEQLLDSNDDSFYRILDVETGELQESVL